MIKQSLRITFILFLIYFMLPALAQAINEPQTLVGIDHQFNVDHQFNNVPRELNGSNQLFLAEVKQDPSKIQKVSTRRNRDEVSEKNLGEGSYSLFLPIIQRNVQNSDVEQGLAAFYPEDEGIANHPAVLFASGFETKEWLRQDFGIPTSELQAKGHQTTNPDNVFFGNGALEYQNLEGKHDPDPYGIYFEGQDIIYVRYYRRYEANYDFSCQAKMTGVWALAEGAPGSGNHPNGYDQFSYRLETSPDPNQPELYIYHPEQLTQYGQPFYQNIGTPVTIETNRWYSIELMLKANDAGQRNGKAKLWIDGVLKAYYQNFRFRDTNSLKINALQITARVGGLCFAPQDQKVWDDNLVLATQYIGPMAQDSRQSLIIDDTNPNFLTQGNWAEYTQSTGQHYGGSHHFDSDIGDGSDTAQWSFSVPEPGNYDVYAWWWAGDYRPSDVPYTINHLNGSDTVRVDQRTNGGRWNLLGTYQFQSNGSVVISDAASSGRDIVADAIRLVLLSEGTPSPEPTATPTSEPTSTPTLEPTATSTGEPTSTPTLEPTATPTSMPTSTPTAEPTGEPTASPVP